MNPQPTHAQLVQYARETIIHDGPAGSYPAQLATAWLRDLERMKGGVPAHAPPTRQSFGWVEHMCCTEAWEMEAYGKTIATLDAGGDIFLARRPWMRCELRAIADWAESKAQTPGEA